MSSYGQYPAAPGATPTGGAAPGSARTTLLLGVAGPLLLLLGSLLAWSTVEPLDGGGFGPTESESSSGINGDGLWTLLLALAAGALLVVGLLRAKAVLVLASLAPSAIALLVVILNVVSPDRTARADLEGEDIPSEAIDEVLDLVEVSAGFGVWIALVGALLAIGSAVFLGRKTAS
ncbi:hypothetical protein [Streptomyces avicenniae]|uniref:hypothetical protein n=1 Tax=Streptomyces avicenniae TaxID=500153 RepID=UPI00069B88C7|nr:hypothetical protein [Streptomyces avicenniae]